MFEINSDFNDLNSKGYGPPPPAMYGDKFLPLSGAITMQVGPNFRGVISHMIHTWQWFRRLHSVIAIALREIPVETIVEVPLVEYIPKPYKVEVPQPYVREVPVDKYVHIPAVQVPPRG